MHVLHFERKSSKTGQCGALARLAAFSFFKLEYLRFDKKGTSPSDTCPPDRVPHSRNRLLILQ